MTSTVFNVNFDCADPYQLASFWSEVTGQPLDKADQPGDPEVAISLPAGFNLYFAQVPEPKVVKNRMHICLRPDDTRDLEVERLIELGATMDADRRNADGSGWVVLLDPEGNEFCVLRSAAEREDG